MNWLTHRRNVGAVVGGCRINPAALRCGAKSDYGQAVPYPYCDRRGELPYSVENQGNEPRCVAEAICNAVEQIRWREERVLPGDLDAMVQPLYRRAKEIEGQPGDGTTLEAGLQAARDLALLPYPIELIHVESPMDARRAIAFDGGFVGAFMVDEGWYYASRLNGYVADGKEPLGGHAVWFNYYDLASFAGPNSWGEESGWRGTRIGGRLVGAGYVRLSEKKFKDQFVYGYAMRRVKE